MLSPARTAFGRGSSGRSVAIKRLPSGWTVHRNREAERRLEAIVAASKRAERMRRWRQRWLGPMGVVALIGSAVAFGFSLSPWPVVVTLKHLAAFPNCNAARGVGLAPARRGQPGYYHRHDADHDGIACEPWPRVRL
jgi:Excalibur calcium-binding domain